MVNIDVKLRLGSEMQIVFMEDMYIKLAKAALLHMHFQQAFATLSVPKKQRLVNVPYSKLKHFFEIRFFFNKFVSINIKGAYTALFKHIAYVSDLLI